MFLSALLLLGGVSCSSAYWPQYGFIASPDFPRVYPADKTVTWNISVPDGFHISLKFLAFNVELSEGCSRDFVTISEPRNPRRKTRGSTAQIQVDGKELGRFCGPVDSSSHPGQRLFVSNDNRMTIELHSDLSIKTNDSATVYSGFKAYYQAVDNDECSSSSLSAEGSSPCQHFCHNYIGGHFCSCLPGFELQREKRFCKVIGGKDCKKPQDLRSGRYTNLTQPDAAAASLPSIVYSCNEPHYRMVPGREGSATFTCSEFGVWMNGDGEVRIPTCVPVCGKPSNPVTAHGRIIGGETAEPGNFPWQVLLLAKAQHGAGILIGEHWVMTAAHLISGPEDEENPDDVQDLHVFMGGTNAQDLRKQGHLEVQEVHVHPGYVPGLHDHDIALIRLKEPVTMDENTSPICLPEDGDESLYDDGTVGYVSGFGKTRRNKLSNLLQYVALPVAQRDRCQQQLEEKQRGGVMSQKFTENMFCAGYPEAPKLSKDSCQGDAGGAFASINEDKWVATGIVSWGFECGRHYGYYTKVINYTDWIKGHLLS